MSRRLFVLNPYLEGIYLIKKYCIILICLLFLAGCWGGKVDTDNEPQEAPITVEINTLVSLYSGAGLPGYKDGEQLEAMYLEPFGLVEDSEGIIYISDTKNHLIRAIDTNGNVSTLAGAPSDETDEYGDPSGSHQDGPAALAQFNEPRGLALAEDGRLYVADSQNGAIRIIHPGEDRQVETLLNNLRFPTDIVIDEEGNLLISETLAHRIIRVDLDGNYTILAGGGYDTASEWLEGGYADGQGENAQFNEPTGLALDSNGTLYVADSANQRIRAIDLDGGVTTIAGGGTTFIAETSYYTGNHADGTLEEARFHFPYGLALGADHLLYVSDTYNHVIRTLDLRAEEVRTIAGLGRRGSAIGSGAEAAFDTPSSIIVTKDGLLLVTDSWNHSIRQIELLEQEENEESSQ